MLTAQQVAQYHTFGFVHLRGWLTPAETRAVRAESEATLVEEYRHQPFDGSRRQYCCMLGGGSPVTASLFEDPRFFDVAEQLHGRVLPYWCDANRYVDTVTGWHPDITPPFEQGGVKFLIYLDELTATTGAIRVIPGSHLRPWHDRVREHLQSAQPPADAVPAVSCETTPGDVVAFNFPLYHAAVGGSSDRRLNTLAYYPYPVDAAGRQRRADEMTAAVPAHRGFGWRGEVYPDAWVAGAASNPRRRIIVDRLMDCGVLQAARAAALPVAV